MRRLLQINPVLRNNTSTGRIMQEIGNLAMQNGWESYIAYSKGRDRIRPCKSEIVPIGDRLSTLWHGVQTRLFDRHGLSSDSATRGFIKQIEHIKPNVIHIHNLHGYFLNYKILFNHLSQSGIPIVWTIHDCWLYTGHCYHYSYIGCKKWQTECGHCPQKREFPASLLFDRSAHNYADKLNAFTSIPHDLMTIVPVSEWMQREMQHSFLKGYASKVIHNGIDTDTFKPLDGTDIRGKYHLQGKHILLGVASIWSREKGLYDFIQLAKLLEKNEAIVLVGIKPEQKKMLPQNIIAIERTENIRQLAELYAASDVFINPTYQDNYPTVNLEAIACGTPIVTYRTGGSVEAVTTDTGTIVGQGNIKGMLDAARRMSRRGKHAYKDACRNYALEHFRKEDCYKEYLQLYDKLAKG